MIPLSLCCTFCGLTVPIPPDLMEVYDPQGGDGSGLVILNCPDAACGKRSRDLPHVAAEPRS